MRCFGMARWDTDSDTASEHVGSREGMRLVTVVMGGVCKGRGVLKSKLNREKEPRVCKEPGSRPARNPAHRSDDCDITRCGPHMDIQATWTPSSRPTGAAWSEPSRNRCHAAEKEAQLSGSGADKPSPETMTASPASVPGAQRQRAWNDEARACPTKAWPQRESGTARASSHSSHHCAQPRGSKRKNVSILTTLALPLQTRRHSVSMYRTEGQGAA